VLIGSWKGERWIPRAAREFDGWIASGAKTSLQALREGIARYRAAGGKRAIVTNVAVDLTVPTEPLPDTEPFQLRCAPEEAARRLEQVRDLGFDDTVLVLKNPTEAGLAAARALLR
jgi:alkanesulfonate monooxygenase SsuD/methylene tetrahydromethanopterin reductase-like flavin-dependent oxidoreductase (luciferase family)